MVKSPISFLKVVEIVILVPGIKENRKKYLKLQFVNHFSLTDIYIYNMWFKLYYYRTLKKRNYSKLLSFGLLGYLIYQFFYD